MSNVKPTFRVPLGGPRWLEVEVLDTPGQPTRWTFARGGALTVGQWPAVIARSLSGVNRFGHNTYRGYSVGRHSVLMSRFARDQGYAPAVSLLSCLHDAPEGLGVSDVHYWTKRMVAPQLKTYEQAMLDFLLLDLGVYAHVQPVDFDMLWAIDKAFGNTEFDMLGMDVGEGAKSDRNHPVYQFLREHTLYDWPKPSAEVDWLDEFDAAYRETTGRDFVYELSLHHQTVQFHESHEPGDAHARAGVHRLGDKVGV